MHELFATVQLMIRKINNKKEKKNTYQLNNVIIFIITWRVVINTAVVFQNNNIHVLANWVFCPVRHTSLSPLMSTFYIPPIQSMVIYNWGILYIEV